MQIGEGFLIPDESPSDLFLAVQELIAPGPFTPEETLQKARMAVEKMREQRVVPSGSSIDGGVNNPFSLWDRETLLGTLTPWMNGFHDWADIYKKTKIYAKWQLSECPLEIPGREGKHAWVIEVQLPRQATGRKFPSVLKTAIDLYHGERDGGRGYCPFFWHFTHRLGAYLQPTPGENSFKVNEPFAEGWMNKKWAEIPAPVIRGSLPAW